MPIVTPKEHMPNLAPELDVFVARAALAGRKTSMPELARDEFALTRGPPSPHGKIGSGT